MRWDVAGCACSPPLEPRPVLIPLPPQHYSHPFLNPHCVRQPPVCIRWQADRGETKYNRGWGEYVTIPLMEPEPPIRPKGCFVKLSLVLRNQQVNNTTSMKARNISFVLARPYQYSSSNLSSSDLSFNALITYPCPLHNCSCVCAILQLLEIQSCFPTFPVWLGSERHGSCSQTVTSHNIKVFQREGFLSGDTK